MLLRPERYAAEESVSISSLATSQPLDVLKQHDFRCGLCKFRARPAKSVPTGFMEVLELNGSKGCYCTLCAQSILLRRVPDGKKNHGHIFYCPTLSQGQVNDLCRYIGLHIIRKTQLEDSARNFARSIKDDLVPLVEKVVPGFSSGDPFAFADLMDNLRSPRPNTGLEHLRYWPNPAVFNYVFKFWDAASFSKSNLGLVSSS